MRATVILFAVFIRAPPLSPAAPKGRDMYYQLYVPLSALSTEETVDFRRLHEFAEEIVVHRTTHPYGDIFSLRGPSSGKEHLAVHFRRVRPAAAE